MATVSPGRTWKLTSCSTPPLSLAVLNDTLRNSISPRARAMVRESRRCPRSADPGARTRFVRRRCLAAAGPLMLTRLRSGEGMSIKAVRNAQEFVDLHVVRKHLPDRHVEHARERDRGDALHHRVADRFGARELHVRGAIELVDLLESLGLVILGVEDLDQAMRIDRFLGDARDVAHRVLNALAVAAETAVGDLHQPADHGCRHDAEQRQPPVHVEHDSRANR